MHAGMVNLNHLSGREALIKLVGGRGGAGQDSLSPSFMSHGTLLHAFDGP